MNLKWSPTWGMRRRTLTRILMIAGPVEIPKRPTVPGGRSSEQRTTSPVLLKATRSPVKRTPLPTNPTRILARFRAKSHPCLAS